MLKEVTHISNNNNNEDVVNVVAGGNGTKSKSSGNR